MARRSGRLSGGFSTTSTPAHKRNASNTVLPISTTKRAKTELVSSSSKAGSTDESEADNSDDEAEASDFQEDGDDAASGDDDDDASDEFTGSDSEFESKRSRNKTSTSSRKDKKAERVTTTQSKQTSKTSGDVNLDIQIVTKKPTARPAGKLPYRDEYVHPNTLTFLGELKDNNQRSWLKLHDAEFRQAEKDWFAFVEKLTERLIDIDDTVPELPLKDIIFRIYRDVRFSKDPTPYKPHFSAAWSRTGRKSLYAVYYLQISPGNSFIGGGLWHPDAERVSRMRSAIDRDSRSLKEMLMTKRVRDAFLDGQTSEKAVINAFIKGSGQDALKTKPKGYDGDHPDIALLRLRSFLLGKKLPDDVVVGRGGLDRIAEYFAAVEPFVTYLNSIVMPDPERQQGSSHGESDEENDDDIGSDSSSHTDED